MDKITKQSAAERKAILLETKENALKIAEEISLQITESKTEIWNKKLLNFLEEQRSLLLKIHSEEFGKAKLQFN